MQSGGGVGRTRPNYRGILFGGVKFDVLLFATIARRGDTGFGLPWQPRDMKNR